jgi:hypothetical protein
MAFETDKHNGFKFDASQLLKSGVFPERFDRKIPFWEDVNGMQYTEFGMRRKAGREEKHSFASGSHTTTKPIRGIATTKEFDDKVAYIGALDKIFSFRLSDQSVDTVTPTSFTLLENANATTWTHGDGGSPSAVDTWDGGLTVWDEGINEAEQWSFETFGNFVVAASGARQPLIKKNNVNFNTFHDDQVSGVTITSPGSSNYAVGDVLTQNGSPSAGSGSGLQATVTEVSGGTVTAIEVTNFGSGYTNTGAVLTMNVPSGSPTRTGAVTLTIQIPDISYDKVKIFKRQGPHMLAFNYTDANGDNPTKFSWCSADDLDDWIASATNTAGSLLIREATGEIMCVTQLGNNLAVYTQNQMFIVAYVGLPNIFGYKPALDSGVGAVSPSSVVSVGRMNYGLSRDGFFVTDGASTKMIGRESGMNEFFRDNVSFTELGQIVAFDNAKENEVVWGIPLGQNKISKEIYYNYKNNAWGMRDSTISAYHERGIFNDALSASSAGAFNFEGNVSTLFDSDVFATTKAHDFQNADRIKEVTQLRVGKEGTGSPIVSLSVSDTIDGTPTLVNSFVIDDTFKNFPVRAAGRYITLKVTSFDANDNYTITDMVIQGRFEGER